MPKKEHAQIVNQTTSSTTDLRQIINGVFDAEHVENDLFGNVLMSKSVMNFLGSNSGFKKAIQSAGFLNFQDTANPKLNKSKTIGLTKPQAEQQISQRSNTSSTTVLISDKITALSPS